MSNGAEHFKAYESYAVNLRTWLVAYGIGGPVLFLNQSTVWSQLTAGGRAPVVAGLFLTGVCLQVLLATLNKTVMWVCYYGEVEPVNKAKWYYRWSEWLASAFWIDFLVDLASLAAFAWATTLVFLALAV